MNPDIWNVFHDGTITALSGEVPGNVHIFIEIRYLRAMLPGNGTGFNMQLGGCTLCEFEEYNKAPSNDFSRIAALESEILSARAVDHILEVTCTLGTLRVAYGEAELALESGEPISNEALSEACDRYWDEWERSAKAARAIPKETPFN